MSKTGLAALRVACSVVVALFALAGCGDSGSSAPAESQLQAAKEAGEEAARERGRVDRLERQVHSLKKRSTRRSTQVVVVGGPGSGTTGSGDGGSVAQTFHTPSGNVSCQITSGGALCSVASTSTTFAFSEAGAANIESGALLSAGAGDLVAYGSTITAGPVGCVVPASNSPHGVVCSDAESGHGFEASRVPARQRAY